MNHRGTVDLQTNRLFLRKFMMDDVKPMFQNWATEEEVTKFLTWPPHENSDITQMVVKSWVDGYSSADFYQWAIGLKEIDEVIGSISVVGINEKTKSVSMGYCIGSKWWGKGVVTEALGALIKFFFEEVQVNSINAKHDVNNPNSGKVMKKCGMVYEGTLRAADVNNQGICDCCMYSILASEYFV